MNIIETLFEETLRMKYPDGMIAVPNMLHAKGFFPGCTGLWSPETMDSVTNKRIMVVGRDFDSERNYKKFCQIRNAPGVEPKTSTWHNLIKVFRHAEIDLDECFFTNGFMGLRTGEKITGDLKAFADEQFQNRCAEFLGKKLKALQPKVVIILGVNTLLLFASLSESLTGWRNVKNFKDLDRNELCLRKGIKPSFGFMNFAVLVHPSMRNSNVKYRSFRGKDKDAAEMEILRQATFD